METPLDADQTRAPPRLRSISPYIVTNLFSALAGLFWVLLFSRGLNPTAYGELATALVCTGLAQTVGFYWLQTSLLRLHPQAETAEEQRALARAAVTGFLLMVVIASVIWLAALALLPFSHRHVVIGLCALPVLLLRGWLGLAQSWNRVNGHRWRYALSDTIQSCGAIALALPGLWLRPQDPIVPLLAILASCLLAALIAPRVAFDAAASRSRSGPGLRQMLSYGGPLGVLTLVSSLLASSDRLLIASTLGVAAVGGYAIGYTLADRSLSLIILSITAATKPMTFQEYERGGEAAAQGLLSRVGALLAGVGVPAAVGLICLTPKVASILVGPAMEAQAAQVLPWAAVGALLSSLLMCHYSLAFQIARRTWGMLYVMVPAVAFNIVANLVLLPRFGVIAAAWTTVASYGLAIALVILLGRREFKVPFPLGNLAKVLVACVPMALYLQLPFDDDWGGLGACVIGGAAIYGLGAFALDVAEIRTVALRWRRRAVRLAG